MDMSTIIWIIVAVIVVLAVAALIAAMMRKRKAEQQRVHAQHLRREAVSNVDRVQQSDVEAKEAEARAERARLEAERAEAQAVEAQRAVDMERATYEDRIREADRIDPDVDHRTNQHRA
jgi:flagellar basal body-associated protein FliL